MPLCWTFSPDTGWRRDAGAAGSVGYDAEQMPELPRTVHFVSDIVNAGLIHRSSGP